MKKYKKYILSLIILIIIVQVVLSKTKKEFPVKIGQTWNCSQEVMPFERNSPQENVTVEYSVKVIDIDQDGDITYSRGIDSMTLDLENFLFLYKLEKN